VGTPKGNSVGVTDGDVQMDEVGKIRTSAAMIETFNNFKLLIRNETWNPLTITCVKFESRLYTRESEEGKNQGGGGRGDGIERGTAHVRCTSFIWTGLSVSCTVANRLWGKDLIVLKELI
jgi:hypothetical protein